MPTAPSATATTAARPPPTPSPTRPATTARRARHQWPTPSAAARPPSRLRSRRSTTRRSPTTTAPPCPTPAPTATATSSSRVAPAKDAPAANNDSATVAEGGTVTVLDSTAATVLANYTVALHDALPTSKLSDPAHGSVTLNANGTFSYSHDGSETTTDSFTYKTCDNGTTGSPPVADPKCSGTATVSITVTPVNDPPVANNDSATVPDARAHRHGHLIV